MTEQRIGVNIFKRVHPMKKSVFISYGRSDVAFVRRLAKFLSKSFSVWHDERLSVGDEFSEEIPEFWQAHPLLRFGAEVP